MTQPTKYLDFPTATEEKAAFNAKLARIISDLEDTIGIARRVRTETICRAHIFRTCFGCSHAIEDLLTLCQEHEIGTFPRVKPTPASRPLAYKRRS